MHAPACAPLLVQSVAKPGTHSVLLLKLWHILFPQCASTLYQTCLPAAAPRPAAQPHPAPHPAPPPLPQCTSQVRAAQLDKEAAELRDENASLETRIRSSSEAAAQDFAGKVGVLQGLCGNFLHAEAELADH